MTKKQLPRFDYDVCLSFAGEDRNYVRRVADSLRSKGVRIFYDEYEQVDMWGKDLYVHLDEIYQNTARFCVLFASEHYAQKAWPDHERQSAQARAIKQHSEYILPAKFDNTKIPGLRPTIGHINLNGMPPEVLADKIIKKIGNWQKENYFPPSPDRLFEDIRVRSKKAREASAARAYHFFQSLQRMTEDEREIIFQSFINGCPGELPDNVHINLDLLRRITKFSPARIRRLMTGVSSLGFKIYYRTEHSHEGRIASNERLLVIEWHDMSTDYTVVGNATLEANGVILGALQDLCETCSISALRRLDFSQLATVTTVIENNKTVKHKKKA
jgi:hypothetical protein